MIVLAIEGDEIETVKALETENDVIILVCCYLKKFLVIGRKNGCNKALNAILSLPSKGIPSSNEKDPENDRKYFDIFQISIKEGFQSLTLYFDGQFFTVFGGDMDLFVG